MYYYIMQMTEHPCHFMQLHAFIKQKKLGVECKRLHVKIVYKFCFGKESFFVFQGQWHNQQWGTSCFILLQKLFHWGHLFMMTGDHGHFPEPEEGM